jgi:hypothetical protein
MLCFTVDIVGPSFVWPPETFVQNPTNQLVYINRLGTHRSCGCGKIRKKAYTKLSPFVANGDIQDMSFSVNNAFEPVGLKRTSLFNVMLFNLRLLKFSEYFFISFPPV